MNELKNNWLQWRYPNQKIKRFTPADFKIERIVPLDYAWFDQIEPQDKSLNDAYERLIHEGRITNVRTMSLPEFRAIYKEPK